MQFDEKDLDNTFSIDDSSTISWEDLLNTDEDVDLSSLVKEEPVIEEKKEEKFVESSINILDDIVEEAPKEEDIFDLSAATNNYVNSLEAEEAGIDNIVVDSSSSDFVSITQDGSAQDSEGKSLDDLLSSISDDDFSTIDENTIISDEKLSDVVDDELLNLLDTKGDAAKIVVNEDEVLKAKQDNDILDELDILTDSDSDKNIEEQENYVEKEPSAPILDNEEVYAEDEYEIRETKPKKSPVLLLVLLVLIGLFGAIYFAMNFLVSNDAKGDIVSAPSVEYGIKDFDKDNDTNKVNTENDVNKQTKELVDKVEHSKQNKVQSDEKKVVVAVPISGRKNPFVPSSLFDDKGFATFGADISMPPDAAIESPEAMKARKLMQIVVSGIMFDSIKPSAIMKFDNKDYFVQKGDRIDDYDVVQITKDYVAIKNGSNVYKAYVGEAFKIKEELAGSTQVKIVNGKRQYISNDDIEISTR